MLRRCVFAPAALVRRGSVAAAPTAASSPRRSCASRFVEEVLESPAASLEVSNAPIGNVFAATGAALFALTYGYHIAKPVYDAYTQNKGDDDDGEDAAEGEKAPEAAEDDEE